MLIYIIKTGDLFKLTRHALEWMAKGYSGSGLYKNDPHAEDRPGLGPIPSGVYRVASPHDSEHTGPYTLDLLPLADNAMHGRSGFKVHGDSTSHPGDASHGCIVLPRETREEIYKTGGLLTVLPNYPEVET